MTQKPRTWRQRAEALAAAIPRERLHPRVVAWAGARTAAARGAWALAVSGGADSLAMALLVWAHWPQRRTRMILVHFDHRQRGDAVARADRRFCQAVAAGLGLPCVTGRWRQARAKASEAELRQARMDFFGQALARRGGRALWLGHQQEDIAETMLMRLARGSGTAGLAAPRPVQEVSPGRVHVRPLLTLTKADVMANLRRLGIAWREDASNHADGFLRNRMRRTVVPVWRRVVQDREALAGAALARERLEEDDAALEAWLDELRVLRRGPVLRLEPLQAKPLALWRRALHRWLLASPYEGNFSRQAFEQLLNGLRARARWRQSLGGRGFAELKRAELRYVDRPRSER